MAVHGTMISSLPPACRQAGTYRGSGASSTRSRSRTVCARIRASACCRRPGSCDDARAAADLPVKPFDHVIRADPPAVPSGELGQEVGRGLAYALAWVSDRCAEPSPLHLRGDLLSLGGARACSGPRGRRPPEDAYKS